MYRYLLQTSFCLLVGVALVVVGAKPNIVTPPDANDVNTVDANTGPHRSPVDLVISHDNSWLVTANQTSNTASLVRVADGTILDEVTVGRRPSGLILSPDGKRVLITASYAGNLVVLEVREDKLEEVAKIHVGFEPHGIAIDPNGRIAYVALTAAAEVAVVDLESQTVTDRIDVGRWPRHLALSPDGSRLAVGTSGDRGVSVVDTQTKKMLFIESFIGLNIGHMKVSSDGKHVYFPWVIYRSLPITKQNIQLGWVLATRIGRIQLDGPARRAAVSLDPRGRAISDPCGLAFTSDEKRLVVSASGTHELLVYRADLPFQDSGGTDHIPRQLLNDKDRFDRIELGGRPMGLQIATDDRTVFVANYLDDSIQVVDIVERKLIRSIPLGGPDKPSLARQGEAIFYDAKRSLDQWYSCQTCHQDGGTNSVVMDTLNDGSNLSFKTVLPLYNVSDTAPWTWHGWQTDLHAAMHKSITSTMLGPAPTDA
ncbi:MAG: beta-propeller fold lactonase family protein, partial [Planctomycetes bacterium]|nr:beta-propeller fold lactonase family protein [Planctomycetota bacterium]